MYINTENSKKITIRVFIEPKKMCYVTRLMYRINDVNVRIRNTVSFRFIIPLSFFHLYYYCIIQVTRSLINLIPHLNGSSIGEVPSRLLKVLFALERMKWRYIGRISWRYDISEKKKKGIYRYECHSFTWSRLLSRRNSPESEEKDSLIAFNNWLLRIYTSILLILMPITLIQNLNFSFFFKKFLDFRIQLNLIVIIYIIFQI